MVMGMKNLGQKKFYIYYIGRRKRGDADKLTMIFLMARSNSSKGGDVLHPQNQELAHTRLKMYHTHRYTEAENNWLPKYGICKIRSILAKNKSHQMIEQKG